MNASTAAKMFALAAVAAVTTMATGCMAPVEGVAVDGQEPTGDVSPEAAGGGTHPTGPVTMPCNSGVSLALMSDAYMKQLYAAGCQANVQIWGTGATWNTIQCPTSATTLVNSKANVKPYSTSIHSSTHTACMNWQTGAVTTVATVSANAGWMFVDYNPGGCKGACT